MKPDFVLWIYPDNRDYEKEEIARNALRQQNFKWSERVEECMSDSIVIDTGFEEIDIEHLDLLKRYSVSMNGELLLCGMTEKEIDKKRMP